MSGIVSLTFDAQDNLVGTYDLANPGIVFDFGILGRRIVHCVEHKRNTGIRYGHEFNYALVLGPAVKDPPPRSFWGCGE